MTYKEQGLSQLDQLMPGYRKPFISIIIPTTGSRPALLRRSIESALAGLCLGDVEVLVIINGSRLWDVDSHFVSDACVRFYRIRDANVSAARNYGVDHANGTLIRFLDDDDYLISEVAFLQYSEMLTEDLDLSTYSGRTEDEGASVHQIITPPDSSDFCVAVLGPKCPALTFATVYHRRILTGIAWDVSFRHAEDEDWLRQIASRCEVRWMKNNEVVGIWYQHGGERLSRPVPVNLYYKNRAISIMRSVDMLLKSDRLTNQRKSAAAFGLWSAIHGGFYFNPVYWSGVSRYARKLDINSRPDGAAFEVLPAFVSPVLIEYVAMPKRWLNHFTRLLKGWLFGWCNVRKI